MVPQDRDTLCPFTPVEIGGDGAYTTDPIFLSKVISDRSRGNYHETLYRIDSLLKNLFSHRFVRSDRLNEVVHKHHLLLPVLDGLKVYLPEEAIVTPVSDVHRSLLESVRTRGLERPQQTWLRLCRGFYYGRIFEGSDPLEPSFMMDKSFHGGGSDPDPNLSVFLRHWQNPGFRFANHDPYFVIKDRVEVVDPLHLPWSWKGLDGSRYPSAFQMFSDWYENEVMLEDKSLGDVIALITRNQPLPDRVVKRLNLFMESDNYIISQLPVENIQDSYFIVTDDLKLCARAQVILSHRGGKEVWVYGLAPICYLVGGLSGTLGYHSSLVPRQDYSEQVWIEDPGSILHCDYTQFSDGFPHDPEVYDAPYNVYRTTHDCVAALKIIPPERYRRDLL